MDEYLLIMDRIQELDLVREARGLPEGGWQPGAAPARSVAAPPCAASC